MANGSDRNKIAFVVVRYGSGINGGAEQHCRMLAERLTDRYDVEVLTTCVKNYRTGGNEFPKGEETDNGILVRRFPADIIGPDEERSYEKKAKPARRLRHLLFRAGILPLLSSVFPVWKPGLKKDEDAQRHSRFYSSAMQTFIREHKNEYRCFIVFTADYAPFYFTAIEAGEKTIAVPTLHNAKISFRPSLTVAFSKIRYTGFNTLAEQRLGKRIFGAILGESGIIGCGIEPAEPEDWNVVKAKYGLPDRYLLCIGRVDGSKTGSLVSYYKKYRNSNPDTAIPLVLVGGIYDRPEDTPGLFLTGFVSDGEKRAILQHAMLLVNPSFYESLSLVVLEALYDRIPVLVNGRCDVLREHCILSGGAIRYYTGAHDFASETSKMTADESALQTMASKGKHYLETNYSWNLILDRLHKVISTRF